MGSSRPLKASTAIDRGSINYCTRAKLCKSAHVLYLRLFYAQTARLKCLDTIQRLTYDLTCGKESELNALMATFCGLPIPDPV